MFENKDLMETFTEEEIIAMPDLSKLRKTIDSLNRDIVLTLSLRREFPGSLHLYDPDLNVRLRDLGVDDVSSAIFLFPIYSKICNGKKNGKYLGEIAKADVLVQDKIEQRVSLGKPVAIWKYYHTASEKITYEGREQEVLNQVSALAKEYELDEKTVREIFSEIIIPNTKSLENCVMKELKRKNNTNTKSNILARTACERIVPVLISQLKDQYGEDRQFKVKIFKENGTTMYGVHLMD